MFYFCLPLKRQNDTFLPPRTSYILIVLSRMSGHNLHTDIISHDPQHIPGVCGSQAKYVPPLPLSWNIHSSLCYPNRISTVLSVQFWNTIPSYQENYLFLKSYYTYNFQNSLALSICWSSFPTCSLRLRACLLKMFVFNLSYGLTFLGL